MEALGDGVVPDRSSRSQSLITRLPGVNFASTLMLFNTKKSSNYYRGMVALYMTLCDLDVFLCGTS